MDIHWYMVCNKETGAAYSLASMDLDDELIDYFEGQPFIKPTSRGFSPRGLSHPEQTAAKGMEIHEVETEAAEGYAQSLYTWDAEKREMVKRDMTIVKQRQLAAAEAEVARLRAELGP